jgi:hypothetical protein
MLARLYALNAALLIAHEIDSAYWREWELFGLGGDGVGFVVLHVPLVLLILWGFERLLAGARAGFWMSVVLGLAGLSALVIHGAFLLQGHAQFRTLESIGVILAAAIVSMAQLILTAQRLRATRPGANRQPAASQLGF